MNFSAGTGRKKTLNSVKRLPTLIPIDTFVYSVRGI